MNEPIFSRLAEKYGKTNAQVILRWHIQEGNIIFPKTTNPAHMKENYDIFDFELTDEEMQEIKKLDTYQRFFIVLDSSRLRGSIARVFENALNFTERNTKTGS